MASACSSPRTLSRGSLSVSFPARSRCVFCVPSHARRRACDCRPPCSPRSQSHAHSSALSVSVLSLQLTNELPSGLRANLQAAFCTNKADIDALSPRPRAILFGLCYFHAIVAERRKFGAAGFNEPCHFSLQDLEDAKTSIINYVEEGDDGSEIPWEDLRYMVGEIIYGGHIVDSHDRLLCTTLLEFIMRDVRTASHRPAPREAHPHVY
jgi:hypothetical protein